MQKVDRKWVKAEDLNNNLNQLDLTATYNTILHITELYQTIKNIYFKKKYTWNIEISYKSISGKLPNIWKLKIAFI